MRRRHLACTFALAGGLLPLLGCWTLPARAPELKLSDGEILGRRLDAPNSGTEKARACMATAGALEAEALKLSPADPLRQGQEREAIKQYELARKHSASVNDRVARRLAVLYDRQGDPAKAEGEYQRALKASPRDSDLLNDYGYFLYQQNNWADAERNFLMALQVNQHNQRAVVNLGMAVAQQGRDQEAFSIFAKALTPAEAHANLGYIWSVKGRRQEAIEAYAQAVQLNPHLKQAHAALEWLQEPETGRQQKEAVANLPEPTAAGNHRPSFAPTGSRQSGNPEDSVQRLSTFRRERERTEGTLAQERDLYSPGDENGSSSRPLLNLRPIAVQPR